MLGCKVLLLSRRVELVTSILGEPLRCSLASKPVPFLSHNKLASMSAPSPKLLTPRRRGELVRVLNLTTRCIFRKYKNDRNPNLCVLQTFPNTQIYSQAFLFLSLYSSKFFAIKKKKVFGFSFLSFQSSILELSFPPKDSLKCQAE